MELEAGKLLVETGIGCPLSLVEVRGKEWASFEGWRFTTMEGERTATKATLASSEGWADVTA